MEPMEKFVKPFVNVVSNVYSSFVGCQVRARNPFFSDWEKAIDRDISAVIGLSGEVRGAVIISMTKEVALKMADLLVTGVEHAEMDEDVVDAVGETVNIIAGNIKPRLPNGERIQISLPTVIKGKDHSFAWPSNQARVLCIPFQVFTDKIFHLLVAIESKEIGAKH